MANPVGVLNPLHVETVVALAVLQPLNCPYPIRTTTASGCHPHIVIRIQRQSSRTNESNRAARPCRQSATCDRHTLDDANSKINGDEDVCIRRVDATPQPKLDSVAILSVTGVTIG